MTQYTVGQRKFLEKKDEFEDERFERVIHDGSNKNSNRNSNAGEIGQ